MKRGGFNDLNFKTYILNHDSEVCLEGLKTNIGSYDINGDVYNLFSISMDQFNGLIEKCKPETDNETSNRGVKKLFKIINTNSKNVNIIHNHKKIHAHLDKIFSNN